MAFFFYFSHRRPRQGRSAIRTRRMSYNTPDFSTRAAGHMPKFRSWKAMSKNGRVRRATGNGRCACVVPGSVARSERAQNARVSKPCIWNMPVSCGSLEWLRSQNGVVDDKALPQPGHLHKNGQNALELNFWYKPSPDRYKPGPWRSFELSSRMTRLHFENGVCYTFIGGCIFRTHAMSAVAKSSK